MIMVAASIVWVFFCIIKRAFSRDLSESNGAY